MKAHYKIRGGNIVIEIEADDIAELFQQIAQAEEVFGEHACRRCKSTNLKFIVRLHDDNKFHELRCLGCGSVLSFGQHKKGGGLFPHRKIKQTDGTEVFDREYRGWQEPWSEQSKKKEAKAK